MLGWFHVLRLQPSIKLCFQLRYKISWPIGCPITSLPRSAANCMSLNVCFRWVAKSPSQSCTAATWVMPSSIYEERSRPPQVDIHQLRFQANWVQLAIGVVPQSFYGPVRFWNRLLQSALDCSQFCCIKYIDVLCQHLER